MFSSDWRRRPISSSRLKVPIVWRYVEDTTASEFVPKGNQSCAQEIVDKVAEWSTQNRVKLNNEKCKELRISFVKNETHFAPIVVDVNRLERETTIKILGPRNLNDHIRDINKIASKRLLFQELLAGCVHFVRCLYKLFSYVRNIRLKCYEWKSGQCL